ncbi:MAG: hypothetical protein WCC10_15250, partial [Tumebacillaceae bacterium]
MKHFIGSLSPDFAVEIAGKYGFFRDDYLGMLRLEHRQQGEEEGEERESLQELVQHLQTQIENWQKQESTLFVTRPFVLLQLEKVLGHVSYLHEIRSKQMLRQVDHHIERKSFSVMRTVPTALGAGRQLSLHFYSGQVEKRLLEQEIPQEHIQYLLQMLHESRSIHQIERHLHRQGVSTRHVGQIIRTLLHPQVLQKQETVSTKHELEKRELRFNHREVEKRLLEQGIPQEHIQHLQQTLHESRNIHQIERHLHQQGLSIHHVDQIMQTLLHPQVLQMQETVSAKRFVQTLQAFLPSQAVRSQSMDRTLQRPLDSQVLLNHGTSTTQRLLQTILHSQITGNVAYETSTQSLLQTFLQPQTHLESTLLQERELRFNHREVEKRLLEQGIPQEHIQYLMQTLHESRNIHQIERHMHEQGLSIHHVDQIMQTLLHPQVLQKQASFSIQPELEKREVRFNHREVEKRLLEQGIPQEHMQYLLQTLHESRNIHQIERHLHEQGLSIHHVDQIMQTLLHPQVLQKQETFSSQRLVQTLQAFLPPQVAQSQSIMERTLQTLLYSQTLLSPQTHLGYTLLQERELRFNHRELETRLLEQEIPQEHIQRLLQTLHESRNIRQIERHLHEQGLSVHHVDQIVQTLLHPQVLQQQATFSTKQRLVQTLPALLPPQAARSQSIDRTLQTLLYAQALLNPTVLNPQLTSNVAPGQSLLERTLLQ